MSDFQDQDNQFEELEESPSGRPQPTGGRNRSFFIAIGLIGTIFVIALIALLITLFIQAPQQASQTRAQADQINAQNTAVAATATADSCACTNFSKPWMPLPRHLRLLRPNPRSQLPRCCWSRPIPVSQPLLSRLKWRLQPLWLRPRLPWGRMSAVILARLHPARPVRQAHRGSPRPACRPPALPMRWGCLACLGWQRS